MRYRGDEIFFHLVELPEFVYHPVKFFVKRAYLVAPPVGFKLVIQPALPGDHESFYKLFYGACHPDGQPDSQEGRRQEDQGRGFKYPYYRGIKSGFYLIAHLQVREAYRNGIGAGVYRDILF